MPSQNAPRPTPSVRAIDADVIKPGKPCVVEHHQFSVEVRTAGYPQFILDNQDFGVFDSQVRVFEPTLLFGCRLGESTRAVVVRRRFGLGSQIWEAQRRMPVQGVVSEQARHFRIESLPGAVTQNGARAGRGV
jgi:hypothetical protein